MHKARLILSGGNDIPVIGCVCDSGWADRPSDVHFSATWLISNPVIIACDTFRDLWYIMMSYMRFYRADYVRVEFYREDENPIVVAGIFNDFVYIRRVDMCEKRVSTFNE